MNEILVDIGNSTTKAANAGNIEGSLLTVETGTGALDSIISSAERLVVCSVAPDALVQLRKSAGSVEVLAAEEDFTVPLAFGIENRNEVGSDRLVAAYEAYRRSGGNVLVICCGTALVFSAVCNGVFIGGNILPGPRLQAEALAQHTSQLSSTDVNPFGGDKTIAGNSTAKAISSGIAFGLTGAIAYIAGKYYELLGAHTVYLSGGWASAVSPALDLEHRLRPNLVLEGLERLSREVLA